MPTIDHENFLDVRDLAELARDCGEILEDSESDEYEIAESRETLEKLANLAIELGQPADDTDAESVSDALEAVGNSYSPTLVAELHFPDYIKELLTDIGDLPRDLPEYLANNIDWDGVSDDLKEDYTSVTLDGEDYFIR